MSDWALYDRGFSLFPVILNTKQPALEWDAYQEAPAPPALVDVWRSRPSNTGVATGAVSNCFVLDCDSLMARALAEAQGIPETLTVATPRGTHFYFEHPGWPISNRAGRTWTVPLDGAGVDGWDIRGDGGYVLGPGSHYEPTAAELVKGKVAGDYVVEHGGPLAPAPDWLLALVMPRARKPSVPVKFSDVTTEYGRAAMNAELAVLSSAVFGTVNEQINRSAFALAQLVAGGEITREEAYGALQETLQAMGLPDDDKGYGTLDRGWQAGLDVPRGVEHPEAVTPEQALGTRDTVAPPPPADGEAPAAPVPQPRSLLIRGQTVWADQMANLFYDCWYVMARKEAFVKGTGLVSPTTFDTVFGGFEFPTNIEGKTKERSAWSAFRLSPSWSCPMVHDICFRPDKTPGAVVTIEARQFINTYEPIVTKRIKGDPSRFLELLHKLLPDQRDYQILTSYMCALAQNPGRKFQWWPVIQGVKGNGKTLLLTALAYAVGQRYTHLVNPEAMGKTGNQFNAWVQGHLFVGIEEIFVSDQRHILDIFKPLVTNVRTALEGKGTNQTTGDNYANGMMLTNHRDGVPISDDERRYAIFWTAQQTVEDLETFGMAGAYFPDLYDWLHGREAYANLGPDYGFAVVNEWLQTTPPVAEFNPAGLCQRAPATSSTPAALVESLGTLEQEVLEAVAEHRPGFRGDWIASTALNTLFASLRVSVGRKRYRTIMSACGYVPHPAFLDGRVTGALRDGSRPRLYVRKGSVAAALSQLDAIDAYEISQAGGTFENASNVVPLRPR